MTKLEDDGPGNIRWSADLKIPHLKIHRPRPGKCVIVGAGPTVENYVMQIRRLSRLPGTFIIALNWTHSWLIQHSIIPSAAVFFELSVDPTKVLDRPHKDVTYYVASHCHPQTHLALEGYKRVLWHAKVDDIHMRQAMIDLYPDEPMLGGGTTTLLRAISIAQLLGYRQYELYGCDSSFPEGKSSHIPGYPLESYAGTGFMDPIKVQVMGSDAKLRVFTTSRYLAEQADQFKNWCRSNHMAFLMKIHGDTMLRYVHQFEWPEMYDDVAE